MTAGWVPPVALRARRAWLRALMNETPGIDPGMACALGTWLAIAWSALHMHKTSCTRNPRASVLQSMCSVVTKACHCLVGAAHTQQDKPLGAASMQAPSQCKEQGPDCTLQIVSSCAQRFRNSNVLNSACDIVCNARSGGSH